MKAFPSLFLYYKYLKNRSLQINLELNFNLLQLLSFNNKKKKYAFPSVMEGRNHS